MNFKELTRQLNTNKMMLLLMIVCFNSFAQQGNPDLPDSSKLTKLYLEAISKREAGQTEFAVKEEMHFRPTRASSPGNARSAGPADMEDRQIQESDVFKLGKDGKKELFLLNSFRGFQVISFKDGIEQAKVLSRFPIFNQYDSEMYYVPKKDTVVVINTEWKNIRGRHQNSYYETSVYVLNVKDSNKPFLASQTKVKGRLNKSRMVGDVLYLITSNGNYRNVKSSLTSLKFDSSFKATKVDQVNLNSNDRFMRTMNVVKVDGKFYVIATSTNWRTQGDTVNLYDITSDQGKVVKILTAKAKGRISEKSQSFIHKDHLIMVSNYRTDSNNRRSISRIAIEAVEVKKSIQTQVADAKHRVTIGDTNGLSARLQDVRVSGDLLYTFWVPANMVDPLDLFDISNPKDGIKHLGQLQFPGWISKAFPLTYNNEKYIVGLGTIVPAVNNEENRRYPQAKLFKIEKNGNSYSYKIVSSVTLESKRVWSNLNGQDKLFEFISVDEGQFQILFPAYFGELGKQGAQIVNLNMKTAVLSEGAKVLGEQSWLKRVFANKELLTLNAFSNMSLAVFEQSKTNGTGVAQAVKVLELARNIIDFKKINSTQGVQIVLKDNEKMELRLVDLSKSDSEKHEIAKLIKLKGQYKWHVFKGNKLHIVTATFKKKRMSSTSGNRTYTYERDFLDTLKLSVFDKETLNLTAQNSIMMTQTVDQILKYETNISEHSSSNEILLKMKNKLFTLLNNNLVNVSVDNSCQYFFVNKSNKMRMKSIGNNLYAFNAFQVKPIDGGRSGRIPTPGPTRRPIPYTGKVNYYLPFVKLLTLSGNQLTCSKSINVAGVPVSEQNGFLVATDMTSGRFYPMHGGHIRYNYGMPFRPYSWNSKKKTYTQKLNLQTSTAELKSILNKDLSRGLFGNKLVTFKSEGSEHRLDYWTVTNDGYFVSRPYYLNENGTALTSLITIKSVAGRDLVFIKKNKLVDIYELTTAGGMKKLHATSTFDQNAKDGSAEYIFNIKDISIIDDQTIAISQGNYGVEVIKLAN